MELIILLLEIGGPKFEVHGFLPGKLLFWVPLPVQFVLHGSGSSVSTMAEDGKDVPSIKAGSVGPTSIERSLIVVKKSGVCLLHLSLGDADAQTTGEAELESEGVVRLELKAQDTDGLEGSCKRVSKNMEWDESCVLPTGNHVGLVGGYCYLAWYKSEKEEGAYQLRYCSSW